MKFIKKNVNPLGHRFGDCSIRALSNALDIDWLTVYDDLYKIGRNIYCVPNDTETIKVYLDMFPHGSCLAVKGKKRKKVKDFEDGNYVLMVANHWTCVKDGICYDLWDCREKTVYRYWKVK